MSPQRFPSQQKQRRQHILSFLRKIIKMYITINKPFDLEIELQGYTEYLHSIKKSNLPFETFHYTDFFEMVSG